MAKNRGHGEGSIYKRKDGLWVGQVTIQGQLLYKYARKKGDVQDWVLEMRNQIQSGLTLASTKITVGDFLKEWLSIHEVSIRPRTFFQYTQVVNEYLIPSIGKIKLRDLRSDQIQLLYTTKLKEGKSQRTVLLIHAILHGALKQALRLGLIDRNPAEAVIRPKYRRKEMTALTGVEARILLETVKGSRLEGLFWLAITTGLREGEILGLKWSDLNWETQRLNVQRQLNRLAGKGLVFSEPKSEAGKRMVVLPAVTVTKLQVHRVVQGYERLFAGSNWQENDLIFPSILGTPLDPRNLYRDFKAVLRQAGLPDIRFHDLRHTAASLLLQQGVHPKVVQELLGHSDIALTLNTYSHVLPGIQEKAAQSLDDLLSPVLPDAKLEFGIQITTKAEHDQIQLL